MKKSSSLFIFILSSLIIGCSNSNETKLSYTDVDTVKEIVKERELDVIWTKEVEGDRLEKNISEHKDGRIAETVSYDISTLKILPSYKNAVYPSIQNFGSLNTANLPEEKRTFINDFCKSISDNIYSGPEGYFKSSYMFNYVFFANELTENWSQMFEEDFPFTKEEMKKALSSEEENEKPAPVFTSWILGEPFIGNDLLQIPVRFFTKNGSLDVTMYMNPKSENSVYQVTIDRWGKSDGRQ